MWMGGGGGQGGEARRREIQALRQQSQTATKSSALNIFGKSNKKVTQLTHEIDALQQKEAQPGGDWGGGGQNKPHSQLFAMNSSPGRWQRYAKYQSSGVIPSLCQPPPPHTSPGSTLADWPRCCALTDVWDTNARRGPAVPGPKCGAFLCMRWPVSRHSPLKGAGASEEGHPKAAGVVVRLGYITTPLAYFTSGGQPCFLLWPFAGSQHACCGSAIEGKPLAFAPWRARRQPDPVGGGPK